MPENDKNMRPKWQCSVPQAIAITVLIVVILVLIVWRIEKVYFDSIDKNATKIDTGYRIIC